MTSTTMIRYHEDADTPRMIQVNLCCPHQEVISRQTPSKAKAEPLMLAPELPEMSKVGTSEVHR